MGPPSSRPPVPPVTRRMQQSGRLSPRNCSGRTLLARRWSAVQCRQCPDRLRCPHWLGSLLSPPLPWEPAACTYRAASLPVAYGDGPGCGVYVLANSGAELPPGDATYKGALALPVCFPSHPLHRRTASIQTQLLSVWELSLGIALLHSLYALHFLFS